METKNKIITKGKIKCKKCNKYKTFPCFPFTGKKKNKGGKSGSYRTDTCLECK